MTTPIHPQTPTEATSSRNPAISTEQPAPIGTSAPTEEQILKVVHPAMLGRHPFTFLIAWLCVIGGIFGGIALAAMNTMILSWISLAIAVAAALFLWAWWFKLQFKTLTITEKRSMYREGILSKFTNEVQHDDVRNIQLDQSFFHRLLGVGNIAISSSGQDTIEIHIKGLYHPQQVIDIIRKYQ